MIIRQSAASANNNEEEEEILSSVANSDEDIHHYKNASDFLNNNDDSSNCKNEVFPVYSDDDNEDNLLAYNDDKTSASNSFRRKVSGEGTISKLKNRIDTETQKTCKIVEVSFATCKYSWKRNSYQEEYEAVIPRQVLLIKQKICEIKNSFLQKNRMVKKRLQIPTWFQDSEGNNAQKARVSYY